MKGLRWVALAAVTGYLAVWEMTFAPWLGAIFAAATAVFLVMYAREAFWRDRYSLEALREIDDRAEAHRLLDEEPSVSAEAEVVCPSCFEPHDRRLPACPRCGRVR